MRHFLLVFALLIFSCSEKKDYTFYKSFEFEVDDITVSSEKVDSEMQKSGENTVLKYCGRLGCVSYLLSDKNGKYVSEENDTLELLFASEKDYRINGVAYSVKKFTMDRNAVDSESQHFWSQEFGILLIKSTSWGGFRIMTQSNQGDQDLLSTLTTILLRDELVQGVDQETVGIVDSLTNKMIEEELKQ